MTRQRSIPVHDVDDDMKTNKGDLRLFMLFSPASFDPDIYANQQAAFDILEHHKVPFETIDGTDSSNRRLRNELLALIPDDQDERDYPQFFLQERKSTFHRQPAQQHQQPTWKHFGDISTLQLAANHWTLLRRLRRGGDGTSSSSSNSAHGSVCVKESFQDLGAEKKHSFDSSLFDLPIASKEDNESSACDKNNCKKELPKPTWDDATKQDVLSPRSEKVIFVPKDHFESKDYSVATHLDKARASTARLDALMAKAAQLRERTVLTGGTSSHHHKHKNTRSRNVTPSLSFLYHRDTADTSSGDSTSSTSCSSSPMEPSHIEEDTVNESQNKVEVPSVSTAGEDITPRTKNEEESLSDVVNVNSESEQPFSQGDNLDEEPSDHGESETEEDGEKDSDEETNKDTNRLEIKATFETDQDTACECASQGFDEAAAEEETVVSLEASTNQDIKDQSEESKCSKEDPHVEMHGDSELSKNGAEELEETDESPEELPRLSADSELSEETVHSDEAVILSEESQDSGDSEHVHEESVAILEDSTTSNGVIFEDESTKELTEAREPERVLEHDCDDDSSEYIEEIIEDEMMDEFDVHKELGNLSVGDFNSSYKLFTKDTTETTEMESFSNFADSMGSLGVDLVHPSSEKSSSSPKDDHEEEEVIEIESVDETIEEDVDEESLVESKILVLIATQTAEREVPYDQQNALKILESQGVDYFTLDGADPTQKELRNELFELSGLGPHYPQFFHFKGNEITFLGDMDDLDDAIETQRLEEWLFA